MDQRTCAFLILMFLLCLPVVHERGRAFCSRPSCRMLARFEWGCPWLRCTHQNHSSATLLFPGPFFCAGCGEQGTVLKRTWGAYPAPWFLSWFLSSEYMANCRGPGGLVITVSFRLHQHANSEPFPFLVSVPRVPVTSACWGIRSCCFRI